ncbi:retrovirus-related pol polyprotein from transposon TNT 1-94 [Tanacetum coccineum]
MSTLAEFMILSGGNNRPPMLKKHLIKKYEELSATKKIQADCDLKATNIVFQGLPSDVYSLVNHHRVAKDLWERVQLLMQGTSLTKQERECKLYDAFDKFAHIKGESLHRYYLRFTQLINDMNIYKMKLEQFQVNTKFLNSLPPERSKFVTDVKLIRDLHTTNFDQLHTYLEQHELHANEVRIMRERNQDPLALGRQSSFFVGTFGTRANISGTRGNNLGQQRVVKCFNCQGEGHMARQCPKPKRKRDATWFRDKVLLVEAQGSGKVLNEEELEFLADPGVAEAKAVLMANLTSYRSDFLSKAPHSENTHNDMLNQSYLLETQNAAVQDTNSSAQQDAMEIYMLERYKEWVKLLEERQNVDLSTREKLIMDDIIREKNALFADLEKEINYLKQTLSEQSNEKELLTKTFNVFKNESKEKEAKNIDKEIALEKKVKEMDNIKAHHIRPMHYDGSVIAKETNVILIDDSEETLMLEEESRSKMFLKQSDPMVLEKKVNMKPINYVELNRLSEDFGKGFCHNSIKNDLRKFKGKDIVDNAAQVSNATTIAPGMYKLDPVTLAPKDKNNRETHIYYLKHTMEQAAILREIVEQAKSLNPLDSASYSACKYVKLIQELLGYVRDTCPDIHKPSEKLVAVTPINKKKTVRFAEPVISSSTSQKQLGSSQTKTKQTTNNSVSTSTGVSRSTKSSRSKSTDNTKNDRILQISSSTQKKNKVEDHSRIVKSCLNKPNCVVEPSGNANVQHSKLNTNSELMCVKCNSSMFDARHELCFLEFVSDMNASSKSKSVKKAKKKEEWKPTGKVFTKIGYNWRPTGRTFTLVGNACPLTRITATNKVPLREPIPLEVIAQESVVTKVYTRRPKVPKTNGSNSKPKIAKFVISNKTEPDTSWGSNTFSLLHSYFISIDLSVVQIDFVLLDSRCSKHMTRDRSQLTNFVHKFLRSSRPTLIRCPIGNELASLPVCLLSKSDKTKSGLGTDDCHI